MANLFLVQVVVHLSHVGVCMAVYGAAVDVVAEELPGHYEHAHLERSIEKKVEGRNQEEDCMAGPLDVSSTTATTHRNLCMQFYLIQYM